MLNRLFIIILLSSLILSTTAMAGILGLQEFVGLAIKNNPEYGVAVEDYLIALQENRSAHSLDDWNLVASGVYQDSYPAPTSGFSANYQNVSGYSVGLERYFSRSGTSLSITQNSSKIRGSYPTIDPAVFPLPLFPTSPYYIADVSVSIVQPLLKDAFGYTTKKSLLMSDWSLKLARIKLQEDWEAFIAKLIEEYREWQRCHSNFDLLANRLKKVKDQLGFVQRQSKYGLSEELDLVQTKQLVKYYELLLEDAKMKCETQTKKMLHLANLNMKPTSILPEKFQRNGNVDEEQIAIEYIMTASNVKKTADMLVELQQFNLDIKNNDELMDISLIMEAKPSSYTTENFSKSISEIGAYRDYTISLSASKPLGGSLAKAEKAKALEELNKAKLTGEQTMLSTHDAITSLYTSLAYLNSMLELNKDNLDLAQKRLVLEQKKYRQGRNSVFFVLQAEEAALEVEATYNETVFAKEKVINQILSLTDKYLDIYSDVLKL